MPIKILMPALSPTMEEGTLAKWAMNEGDTVSSGDILAEIETDKATMEVEAVEEGVLGKILIPGGTENVPVNAVIALLLEDGEDASALEGVDTSAGTPAAGAAPQDAPAISEAPIPSSPPSAPSAAPGKTAPAPVVEAAGSAASGRIKASPLAKRLAKEAGIDLAALVGTGPGGRIVKSDVERAKASGGTAHAAPGAIAGTGAGGAVSPDGLIMPQILDDRVYAPARYELVPLDGMRKTVARRLTESFMQIPHFPLTVEIQLDKLLAARAGINAAAPEGVKISVNDMLIKASAMALMAEPDCNASYSDHGIAYHKSAHISVAVAIDGGLVTPVIRDAQTLGLAAISAQMKDLAGRARERKLKPQEYMGGTFSLSNLGMFGIKHFASIINPPEGMIMSVGAGAKTPVVAKDGSIKAAMVMSVTLTCDHRVIGGAEGAKWLNAFKAFVESPESMLL